MDNSKVGLFLVENNNLMSSVLLITHCVKKLYTSWKENEMNLC
jgi:hypothetical protein